MSYFDSDRFAGDIKTLWGILGGLLGTAAILIGVVYAQGVARDNRDGFQYQIRKSMVGTDEVTLSHRRNLGKSYLAVKKPDGCMVEYTLNNAPDGALTLEQKVVFDKGASGAVVGKEACEAGYNNDSTVLGGTIKATPVLEKYVNAIIANGSK